MARRMHKITEFDVMKITKDCDGNICILTRDGEVIQTGGTLTAWSRRYPDQLIRVNQSEVVATDYVRANVANKKLVLANGESVVISPTYFRRHTNQFNQFKLFGE